MIRVSIIMAVYNGAATISRALDSAFAQRSAPEFEIIVANDGSTDATAEILQRYAGRITVVEGEHRGNGPARNRAIARAHGEYLAFLDADDVWLPDKLARTVAVLDSDPGAMLVYSNALVVNEGGEVVRKYVRPDRAHAPTLAEMLGCRWPILESMTVIRKAVLEAVGGFWEEPGAFRANGAYFIFLLVRELGRFAYIDEPLVRYLAAPYPDFVTRDEEERNITIERLRQRYGRGAARSYRRGIMRDLRPVHAHHLGYMGLVAMSAGHTGQARRLFMRALIKQPLNLKNALRLLRTFLPRQVARSMTGRTGMRWN